jgi:hypothetical protein
MSNDEKMSKHLDFSNIEALMVMYPTILWLQLMQKDNTYVTQSLLKDYILLPARTKGQVLKSSENSIQDTSNSIPSFTEFVGDAPEFEHGIHQFILEDCTPSPRFICPDLDTPITTEAIMVDKQTKESLAKEIKQLVQDIQNLHATTRIEDTRYTFKKRVMVDHLLSIIKSESVLYAAKKNKSRSDLLSIIWRYSIYFRAVFELTGFWNKESYERILSFSDSLREILIKPSEPDDAGSRIIYLTLTMTEMNNSR